MLGAPAAAETTPPSTAISEVVKESGTGAAKSGIDKAVFHIDSAILNIKETKKAAEKKDTAAPAPAPASAKPGEGGLQAEMRERAEKKVAERHGERGPLDDDQKEDLKEEVEAQIKIEIQEEIKKIEGTTDEKGETLTKGTLTEKKDERDTAIKADEELKQGMAQAADDNLDAQTRTLEEVEIEQADVQPIIDAAEEAAEKLRDIGKDVGEGSLQYKEQEKITKDKEKAAEQAQGWVGQKKGDVQRGLVKQQREKQEKVDVKAQRTKRSATAGKLAAGVAFAGTAGIETMMGPEASDAKTAAMGFAKGATEAGQIMAAVPGPVGVALGAMKGLTTVAEGLIEFKSGIATVRKEAEIQKQHFQETNSALTAYSQALNDLTNSYGDPTVTQKTIDRLNKKMEDAMSGMPNTKEAQQIKAEIQSAATPEQKQRAVANAQDLMARTQAKSEQSVNFAEMGLKRDKTSGIGGAMIGLFGGGGGWSEGGGRMFDKRGLMGGQSKAQAIESKETLRKATTQFMGNMTAQEATGVESIMDSGAGPMAAIDQMEEMGIMSSEMADALRENADDAADFINSLDRMVDVRKREKEVAREMAQIREKDISKINQLKGAAQSVQAQMDNLAATLVTMNQIRVTKQLKQGERSTDISAAFGRRGGTPGTSGAGSIGRETRAGFFGGRTTFDPSGAALQPQGQTGKPDMVGNVARAAMLAEGGRGSVNELFYGDESVAAVEDAAEMNRLEENRQTGSEQIRNQAQREVGEAAAGAFNADKLINTITGPDGAKKVVDEQQAKNMAVGSAIVQEQVAKAQQEGMGPKETANAIKAGMQDAAIKESIEELKKEGKGDDDPQVAALNKMKEETSRGQAVEGAKLTSQLKGDSDADKGSAVAALQELDKGGLEQASLAAEQKMVDALDGLNSKALEDIQIAKKNQIEAAKTREAMRNIKAGGGIAAFKDRKTERKIDRDMRRSAMTFATAKDPVKRGRAAAQLGKQVQDMMGGAMGAGGKGLQQIAIKGNTERLKGQFGRQIKIHQRARARTAAGSDERAALDGIIGTLEKGRDDSAKIAAAQVKADQKLQEMPANVEKQVSELKEINAKLAETRDKEITVNADAMAASMKGPIEAQTTKLMEGMKMLEAAMEKINQESQQNVDKQAKQQAAMSLVKEATMLDSDAMGFDQSEKLKEAIASGDTDKITAAASEASAHLAKNKDQLTGDQKKEIRGFQETAGVGNTADRNAVKTAQASVEKAQAEVSTAKQGGDPDEIKKAEAKLKTAKTGLNKANYDRSQNMREGDSQHNLAEGAGPESNRDWGQAANVIPAVGVTAATVMGAKAYGGQAFDWAKRKTGLGKPGGVTGGGGGGGGGGGARGGIRGAIDKFRGNRALGKTMDGVKGADKLKAFNVAKQAGQTTPQALKSAGVSAGELGKLKQADKLAQGGKAATQAGKAGAQGAKAGAQAAKGLSAGSKALGVLGKVAVPVGVALNALDLGKLILNPGEMTANFEKANANAGMFTRGLNGMSQPFTAVATNFKVVGQTLSILSDASKQANANLKRTGELAASSTKGRRIRAGTGSEYAMDKGPESTSIGQITNDMLEDNRKLKEQGMDDKELTAVSAAGGLSDEQKGKIEKAKAHATSTVGAAITQAQSQVDDKTERKRGQYANAQKSIDIVGLFAESKGIEDRDSINMGDVKKWVAGGMSGAGEEWEGDDKENLRLQTSAQMEGISSDLDYSGLKDLNNDLATALDEDRINIAMAALEESFKAGGVNMEAVLASMGTDLESLAHQLTGDTEMADETEAGLKKAIETSTTADMVDEAGAENLKEWEEQSATGKFDAVADLDKQIAETKAQGGDTSELEKERATRVKNIRDIQSEKGIDAAMQYSTLLQKRDDEVGRTEPGTENKVAEGYDAAIESFGVDEGGEAEADKAEKVRLEAMRAQGHGGAADQIEKNKTEREGILGQMKDLRMEGLGAEVKRSDFAEGEKGDADFKKAEEDASARQSEFTELQNREQQLSQQNVTMQQEAFTDPAVAAAANQLFSAGGVMAKQTGGDSAMMDPNKTTPVFVTNWPGQNNDLTGRVFGGSIEGGQITSYGTPGTEMHGQRMGAIPGAEAGMGDGTSSQATYDLMHERGNRGPLNAANNAMGAALNQKISLPGGISNVAPNGLAVPPVQPDGTQESPNVTPYRPDMATDVEVGTTGGKTADSKPADSGKPAGQKGDLAEAHLQEIADQLKALHELQKALNEVSIGEGTLGAGEGTASEVGGGSAELKVLLEAQIMGDGEPWAKLSQVQKMIDAGVNPLLAANPTLQPGKEKPGKSHAGNTPE